MNQTRDGTGDGTLALSAGEAEEIDRLCDRFEAAWRAGGRPRFEDQLPAGDVRFRAALQAELIAVELEWRRRGGDARAHGGAGERAAETIDVGPAGRGVLETLSASVGAVPHVLLRDTDGGPEPPLHRPAGGQPGQGTRFRIDGEIARGGMGAILKGRDPDLGRDVALKVLREDFRDDADMVRRFVEEAQIGGQLQHPGIVPIYEIGTFGDRRPFFSMKLVKGDTLAKLLAGRSDPASDLPRFLTIFESVAQTVAYAHARGVIHRDLKPANVMVGSFGEVQVMDWGLAKVLPRGGVVDDATAGKVDREETVIRDGPQRLGRQRPLARRVGPGHAVVHGARAGPRRGRAGRRAGRRVRAGVDPLRGPHRPARLHRAELGRDPAQGRGLARHLRRGCPGSTAAAPSAELIALTKGCLAREPEDRPNTAGAVSARLTAYLAGVQERLRRAELESVEERARRRLTTVAAAALILLGLAGAGVYAWNQRQKTERAAKTARAVDEALADASLLRGESPLGSRRAKASAGRWAAALAAAKRAESLVAPRRPPMRRPRDPRRCPDGRRRARPCRRRRATRATKIEVDRVLLADLESHPGAGSVDHRELKRSDAECADVFREAGLDLDVARTRGGWPMAGCESEPVEMSGYLDDWAFVRRRTRPGRGRLASPRRRGQARRPRPVARSSAGRKLGSDDSHDALLNSGGWPTIPGSKISRRRGSCSWPASSSSAAATAPGPLRSCGVARAAILATSASTSNWPSRPACRWNRPPPWARSSRSPRRPSGT